MLHFMKAGGWKWDNGYYGMWVYRQNAVQNVTLCTHI